MWKTSLRRFLIMIPQLFILSIFVFIVAKMLPGDPFTGLLTPEISYESIIELRQKLGLNDPLYVQYIRWIKNVFRGDFGISYVYKLPVITLIGERIWNTFLLSLLTLILTYLLAIPFGILSGKYDGSRIDKAITLYNFISYSIPTFVLAILSLWLFGYQLRLFPTSGSVSLGMIPGTFSYWLDKFYHALLPALTTAVLSTVGITRYLRNEIIDAKTSEYVKTAKSKGLSENLIYKNHIFRNSLLPIATFFGYQITGLLGGSIFIESIFGYPGMGQLFVQAITGRDYSIILILIMFYGFLTLLGTLLSDIILTIVDPRIRIQ